MKVWPKSFYTFGVGLKTAAAEWKVRQSRGAVARQEKTFRDLVATLATTKFWTGHGIEKGMSYPEFQSRVAPRGASELAAAIHRMKAGEPDVLWPGRCTLFAATAGTTRESPAHLPVTEAFLGHVRRSLLEAALYYNVRARHAGVFRGRHLWVGGSTAIRPLESTGPDPAYLTQTTGVAAAALPDWAEQHFYEPGGAIGEIDDWAARLETSLTHAAHLDISLVATMPPWAIALARSLRDRSAQDGRPIRHLQELWPNFEALVHTGVPIGPFYDELRELLGPAVRFHEVYAATEAFVATQDGEPVAGLRLMADLGVFFEFLPAAEFDPERLAHLGPRLVPLAGVKSGTEYAIFVTTPAGLVRYPLDDMVRFVSTGPPRLVYSGRTGLRLNAFGEGVGEKDVTDALVAVCQRNRWTVVNFHVAPLFGPSRAGAIRGRHEWWVELNAGTVATPRGPQLAGELDVELCRLSTTYADGRRLGALEPPIVRLVMPGVFKYWLQYRHRWGGQHKTPRCRSDRAVADELAQVTQFARD